MGLEEEERSIEQHSMSRKREQDRREACQTQPSLNEGRDNGTDKASFKHNNHLVEIENQNKQGEYKTHQRHYTQYTYLALSRSCTVIAWPNMQFM